MGSELRQAESGLPSFLALTQDICRNESSIPDAQLPSWAMLHTSIVVHQKADSFEI